MGPYQERSIPLSCTKIAFIHDDFFTPSPLTPFGWKASCGGRRIRTPKAVTPDCFQDSFLTNSDSLQVSPPEITVSSYFGFLFLKNLRGIPHKNIQHYWEEVCHTPLFPRCPTHAVDILRNHSLSLDSKTMSISYSLFYGFRVVTITLNPFSYCVITSLVFFTIPIFI